LTIETRKNDHIKICIEKDVQSTRNYWDDIILPHRAIPEVDLSDVVLQTEILGRKLKAPIIISAMTGGTPQAEKYNEILARAASELGIGLGVGSQRAGIENREYRSSYEIVKNFDVPLILGNLGAPQFSSTIPGRRYGTDEIIAAREMVGAHGICLHLNYLQEVVQPEGDCFARGFLDSIRDLSSDIPIIAKETGAGISKNDALKLKDAGVSAIDVGGMSGTTFSGVESFRNDPTGRSARLGSTLWDWGIPTPVSLMEANVGLPLIGTGGIRNGLDIARALSLGASAGGMAWRILMAASEGYEALEHELHMIMEEVRAVLFLSGAAGVNDMQNVDPIIIGRTGELLAGKRG
jgi:isopentenyl-diphosphate delta-isomerase